MQVVHEQPFSHAFTCRGCGSELIAEAEDVAVGRFGANYGGDIPERRYYVTCPVCGTETLLETSKVPPRVREMADRKAI